MADTSPMTDLHISFQSERHIAPYVIPYVTLCELAYEYSGRYNTGVVSRSEAAVLDHLVMDARCCH